MKKQNTFFLPYQIDWLNDRSPVKVWEKSRRIGATYVQAFEDVRDCIEKVVPAVWFSSADESAAREYILYCVTWAKVYNTVARELGEIVLDEKKNVKAFVLEFSNGARINALSSNPKAFRSKGGKVVLDEFAFHNDQAELWKAAKPVITWGFPLRILSTHKGQQNLFYKFIQSIKKGSLKWSLHTTDIFRAVEDGLVDKIFKRKTTQAERTEWLQQLEQDAFDAHTWQEEYCCIAVDESTAFLPYELIMACEADDRLSTNELSFRDDQTEPLTLTGPLFIGYDVGRKKDLSVIWVMEEFENHLYTRLVKIMERTPFKAQQEVLFDLLRMPNVHRCCIDATGLGMQMAETAQEQFGKYRIEAVMFTGRVKEEMAFDLLTRFQDKTITIPADKSIREDFHSIRKIVTAANNIRFDVAQSDVSGHADRFWACALAAHAAKKDQGPVIVRSRRKLESKTLLQGF